MFGLSVRLVVKSRTSARLLAAASRAATGCSPQRHSTRLSTEAWSNGPLLATRAGANGDIVVPEERGGLAGYVRYLLPSYVHMHNNRLGLAISDEVYLAYLADQAFSHHV